MTRVRRTLTLSVMQRCAFCLFVLWSLSSISGCREDPAPSVDPGECTDPLHGRTLVRVDGQVMYAGQAIMLVSCADCHGSFLSGSDRRGAPVGLDFDVEPIASIGAITGPSGAIERVEVDYGQQVALGQQQRVIYDEAKRIWGQVESGAMPPDPGFEQAVRALSRLTFEADGTCREGAGIASFDEAKEELRKWLACGVPVVEANNPMLPFMAPRPSSAADEAAGVASYAGEVGYQLPSCAAAPLGGGAGAR